jgi:hypothetical protein
MLPYQEFQLGQWKLLLMKSGHHNSLVQQVGEGNPCLVDFPWSVRFLGLCKVKKLPYLILLRSFLQCFCMVFYPISSILDQFFCFICIQFLADYKDFSQDLMEYMLPPQLPELPQSQHDLTKVLFREQCGKIPLTGKPTLPFEGNGAMIQRFLIQADDSELPLMLSAAMKDLRHSFIQYPR